MVNGTFLLLEGVPLVVENFSNKTEADNDVFWVLSQPLAHAHSHSFLAESINLSEKINSKLIVEENGYKKNKKAISDRKKIVLNVVPIIGWH